MKIQVKKARQLLQACTLLTGGTHNVITQLASGEKSSVAVRYELEDQARWNIDKNLSLAKRMVETADQLRETAARKIAARIFGGNGIGRTLSAQNNPNEWAEYQTRLEEIEELVDNLPLLKIREQGLKISNSNPIPGLIKDSLRACGLLIEDVKAPPADDVIADADDQVPAGATSLAAYRLPEVAAPASPVATD